MYLKNYRKLEPNFFTIGTFLCFLKLPKISLFLTSKKKNLFCYSASGLAASVCSVRNSCPWNIVIAYIERWPVESLRQFHPCSSQISYSENSGNSTVYTAQTLHDLLWICKVKANIISVSTLWRQVNSVCEVRMKKK